MSSNTVLLCALLTALGCAPTPQTTPPIDPTDPPADLLCPGAATVLDSTGEPTGFSRCLNGALFRDEDVPVSPTQNTASCQGNEEVTTCLSDDDCTDRRFGRCSHSDRSSVRDSFSTIEDMCSCTYSCETDADCGDPSLACVPGPLSATGFAVCVSASCHTHADCGAQERCVLSTWNDGCGERTQLACHGIDDCMSDEDCEGYDSCQPDGSGWSCQSESCAIGRPLRVGEGAATAPLRQGVDWRAELGMDAERNADLAAYWAGVAAMEHASVASFARVALQLMALGAPSSLVMQTQQAMADEIRHAQLTYGLASTYAGEPMAPGPLPEATAPMDSRPQTVLEGLVMEACVVETLGVAEAFAAAESCVGGAQRALLRGIATDEQRHAQLAWRTLKWLLEEHPELRPVARRLFDEQLARVERGVYARDGFACPSEGVLGHGDLLALHRSVAREVLRPAVAAVFPAAAVAA